MIFNPLILSIIISCSFAAVIDDLTKGNCVRGKPTTPACRHRDCPKEPSCPLTFSSCTDHISSCSQYCPCYPFPPNCQSSSSCTSSTSECPCICSSSCCSSSSYSSSSWDEERCCKRTLTDLDFIRRTPQLGKSWAYWQYDGLVADGGTLKFGPEGGYLDTSTYSVSAQQSMVYWKDHYKYFIYARRPVNIPERGRTTFEFVAQVATDGKGCKKFPFPCDVVNSFEDVRLASGGFSVFEPTSGMNFAFHLTNQLVYAVYERNVTRPSVSGFAYFIPVQKRRPKTVNTMQIVVDSNTKSVDWLVNGKKVFHVERVGQNLQDNRCNKLVELNGPEYVTFPRSLNYGFGSFTFLDYYPACRPDTSTNSTSCNYPKRREGLVRTAVNYALPQYNPLIGYPELARFFDNLSTDTNRLWGQGSRTLIKSLKVHQETCYTIHH